METKNEHIDPVLIISKYLAHEASIGEIQWLDEWVSDNDENRKVFDQYKRAWEESDKLKGDYTFDLDKEWDYLQYKIKEKRKNRLFNMFINRGFIKASMRVASVLLVVLSLSSIFYYFISKRESNVINAKTEIKNSVLPDGSNITLNKNSKLTYSNKFNKEKRFVKLKGEAYFDVKIDKTKSFVIDAGEVMIEVLGTAFYVNATKRSDVIEVIVNHGSVGVYPKNKPTQMTILQAGNKAVYEKSKKKITKLNNSNINYLSWKTRIIRFKNDKLSRVIKTLNKIYDCNIIIENENAKNCRITTTFDNQSLDAVLRVLEALLNIHVEKKGNQIIITGEGC